MAAGFEPENLISPQARNRIAARILKSLSLLQLLVPTIYIVATIPGSLYFLLLGGTIVVGPLFAFGFLGIGLSRSLRAGARRSSASLFALAQSAAYVALAMHSATWDPQTEWETSVFPVVRWTLWLVAFTSFLVPVLVLSAGTSSGTSDARKPLRLWIVLAVVALVLILFGIAQPASN